MENYLTAGDLALIENRRGFGYGYNYDGCGYGYGHKSGAATTGIGLAAGLGGGALLLAIAGIWGVNQASKARSHGAEQANTLLAGNLNALANMTIAEKQSRELALQAERTSRESWQNFHAPTTTQYVDVRSGAFAGAGSNALATAEANLLTSALMGNVSCPQKVSLYSAPQPCACPCGCNG